MSNHRLSLAQQIALLDQPTPIDVDPEDDHGHEHIRTGSTGPEDANDASAAAREHYVDVGPSALRKAQQSVSDPKYDGVKTSRKALLDDSEPSEDEQDDEGAEEPAQAIDDEEIPSGGEEQPDSEEQEDEDEEETDQDEPRPPPPPKSKPRASEPDSEEPEPDLASALRQTRAEDVKKGKAIKRQLALWDTLLDARIRMQKSVVAANALPLPAHIPQYAASPRCAAARSAFLAEALALADELSLLRVDMMRREDVSVDRPRPGKRRRIDGDQLHRDGASEDGRGEVEEDWEESVREASEWAAGLEHAYHPHLTRTLAKWSAKIAAVAPGALLPTGAKAFSRGAPPVGAAQQVDAMFPGAGARTRIRRGKGGRIGDADVRGGEEKEGGDGEVFDDTDFYQQLLRDVIDARGAGAGEDWKAAQKERKKRKGAVDTKASKGRKLRYEVHEKMQNFMVPMPMPFSGGGWHEEQVDELFASLLGRGFGDVGAEAGVVDGAVPTGDALGADVLKGFRMFG